MANYTYNSLNELFAAICDALREKLGTAELISHQQIPELIRNIGAAVQPISLVVSSESISVDEGNQAAFTVCLAEAPKDTCVVSIARSTTGVIASASSLTFTPANYNVPQRITITTQHDTNSYEDLIVDFTLSGEKVYTKTVRLTVNNIDVETEEAVEMTLSTSSLSINEGSSGTFTVALTGNPKADKVVTLTSSLANVTLSPSTLTFTSSNYSTARTVTVTCSEDKTTYTDVLGSITATSEGSLNKTINITVKNVTVKPEMTISDSQLSIDEEATATFEVYLSAEIQENKTVNMTTTNGFVSLSPESLTFTPENYGIAQVVTVTGIRDTASYENKTDTITLTQSAMSTKTVSCTINNIDVEEGAPTGEGYIEQVDFSNIGLYEQGQYTADSNSHIINSASAARVRLGKAYKVRKNGVYQLADISSLGVYYAMRYCYEDKNSGLSTQAGVEYMMQISNKNNIQKGEITVPEGCTHIVVYFYGGTLTVETLATTFASVKPGFTLISCDESVGETSNVAAESRFSGIITADDYFGAVTAGWNLGNTLDAVGSGNGVSEETAWNNPAATQELVDFVNGEGINAVRIPITWSQHINWSSDSLTIDSAWLARVREVVDYCFNDDMLVIINTHHDHSVYQESNSNFRQWLTLEPNVAETTIANFKKIWAQIATYFKDYDNRLAFEGWNEIQGATQDWNAASAEEWGVLNRLAQAFVDTVRSTGGNNGARVLIVNPPMTSDVNMATYFVKPTDTVGNRLATTAHPYDNGVTREKLLSRITPWVEVANHFNMPVVFGEVGSNSGYINSLRAVNHYNYAYYAKINNIKSYYWDAGDFAITNRYNHRWIDEQLGKKFIEGATASVAIPVSFNQDLVLNDLSYWESGWMNGADGTIATAQNNSKVLKAEHRIPISYGEMVMVEIASHDNGIRMKEYAFYDANGNYLYGLDGKNAQVKVIVAPPNAAYFNFTFWNPWGNRTDAVWTNMFANGQLNISVKTLDATEDFEDERTIPVPYASVDLNNFKNWKSGQYSYSNGSYESYDSRICLKKLLTFNANSTLNYTIKDAKGKTYDTQAVSLVVRYYDKNGKFTSNKGAWNIGTSLDIGTNTVLSLSMYSPNNTYTSLSAWQDLFAAGLTITLTVS